MPENLLLMQPLVVYYNVIYYINALHGDVRTHRHTYKNRYLCASLYDDSNNNIIFSGRKRAFYWKT